MAEPTSDCLGLGSPVQADEHQVTQESYRDTSIMSLTGNGLQALAYCGFYSCSLI